VRSSSQAIDPVGYDGGKKVKGRKRHLNVYSLGMIIALIVHGADIQDRDGCGLVCDGLLESHPLLDVVFADGGYAGPRAAAGCPVDLAVVKRTEPGFVVLAKRWIVERTFAWLTQNRRLDRDYEGFGDGARRAENTPVECFQAEKATAVAPRVSEAFIRLVMIRLMLNRIFPKRGL
jgi:transposase